MSAIIVNESRLDRLEEKVDRIEQKLDLAVQADASIGWLKWIVGGAWLAIAGVFATK